MRTAKMWTRMRMKKLRNKFNSKKAQRECFPGSGSGAGSSGSGNRFRNRNRGTAKNLEPILEPVPGTAKIRNRFGTGTAEPPKSGTALEPEPRNREELGTASEPELDRACAICGPLRYYSWAPFHYDNTDVDRHFRVDDPLAAFTKWLLNFEAEVLGLVPGERRKRKQAPAKNNIVDEETDDAESDNNNDAENNYMLGYGEEGEKPISVTTYAYAHAGSRYDHVLIYGEMLRMGVKPSLVRQGNHLLELRAPKKGGLTATVFRDSIGLGLESRGKVSGSGSSLEYREISGFRSVCAEMLIPKSGIFYYEVTILKKGDHNAVFIGLGTKEMPLDKKSVGQSEGTYAYGSEGTVWGHECNKGRLYITGKPVVKKGGVIECGVDWETGRLIYTQNGERLGGVIECGVDWETGRLIYTQNGERLETARLSDADSAAESSRSNGRPRIVRNPKFKEGDVIGCGVNLKTGQIIYTKNKKLLDTAGLLVADSAADLYPCISLYNSGTKIEANFGPEFEFKIAEAFRN
uniref:B30.2/SPRY domain-containing protein n=1 Tax=Globodera pallida TaxID=36090 RepID=A0A183C7T2_GLOPA